MEALGSVHIVCCRRLIGVLNGPELGNFDRTMATLVVPIVATKGPGLQTICVSSHARLHMYPTLLCYHSTCNRGLLVELCQHQFMGELHK